MSDKKDELRCRKVVTRERARELDKIAEERYSIPTILLMENAGKAVAQECIDLAKSIGARRFLVVAGAGNNGGDGFCAAKHIKNAGFDVKIALIHDEEKIKGDALQNYKIAKNMGIEIKRIEDPEELRNLLDNTDIVIDAIFGTGLSRDIEDEFIISVINEINQWQRGKVVSVDIPSGLDANTGIPRRVSVRADITVTFAPAKVGLFIGEFDKTGEVKVHDIGIPKELWGDSEIELVWDVSHMIKGRHPLSHKGKFGHLLCVVGGVGRAGAAILVGKSALRVGAGLVTLMVPQPIYHTVASGAREYMVFPAPYVERSFSENAKELFDELVEGKTAVVVGPGIWNNKHTMELLMHIIATVSEKKIPTVFDADALNILSETHPNILYDAKSVITPHPGEASRILAKKTDEIQKDRIGSARELVEKTSATVCVLKGARTIITDGKRFFINMSGGVELATGGTGDVLSGIIGGLLAQGYSELESAICGVFIHGIAGKLAKRENFSLSLADEVCEKIQDALSYILKSKSGNHLAI